MAEEVGDTDHGTENGGSWDSCECSLIHKAIRTYIDEVNALKLTTLHGS